jgi:hypothetical protein
VAYTRAVENCDRTARHYGSNSHFTHRLTERPQKQTFLVATCHQACLARTLLTLIERSDVCVVLVCWLRLDFVPHCVVVGALGSLRFAFHPYNSFCLLSAPLSIVTATCHQVQHLRPRASHLLAAACHLPSLHCAVPSHSVVGWYPRSVDWTRRRLL